MRSDTKRFSLHALAYLLPNLFVRGLTLLLTPLYTRVMSPEDYALLAVVNALTTALGFVLCFALYGAVPRLMVQCEDDADRKRFFGTLLIFSLVVPTALALGLHAAGVAGALDVFETVKYRPHVQYAVWTAWANVFLPLPTAIYMAREEPHKVALLNVLSGGVQLGLTLFFVLALHQGALGVLRAGLVSGVLSAIVSVYLMARLSSLSFVREHARRALAFSLPLVPHLLANWALAVSDRLILERNVAPGDLGRYSLGFLLGLIVQQVAAAVTSPIPPAANLKLRDPARAAEIPPLGTHALFAIVTTSLLVAANAAEVVHILAPRAYDEAAAVVPWLVLGSVFQGLYLVWVVGTFYSMRTKMIPLVTLAGAAVNITLNLIFVPKYGIKAAAVCNAVGYGASAIMHGLLAQRLQPIPWQYRRWIALLASALAVFAATRLVHVHGWIASAFAKTALVAVLYPTALVATRFFGADDVRRIVARLRPAQGERP